MQGAEYPYVIPVSFGMEVLDHTAVIYFHSAQQGLKPDLLRANPHVCVEGDLFLGKKDMSTRRRADLPDMEGRNARKDAQQAGHAHGGRDGGLLRR